MVLTGCSAGGSQPRPGPDGGPHAASPGACGPPSFADVRGPRPSYVPGRLDRFRNDHAMCAGRWVRADASFVPQSLAVDGRTAYVGGYDGGGPRGTLLCRVLKVDLRTGRVLAETGPVRGRVGARPPVSCRHGGGLALVGSGLWLAEGQRLWQLDPGTLQPRRVWALSADLRGSFAVTDDRGRIGLGEFRFERSGRLHWVDPEQLVEGDAVDITTAHTSGRPLRVPPRAQGGFWADLGRGPAGVWFVTSSTRCGVLVGPGGARRAFLPGAEGSALGPDGQLWTVSEATSRPYYTQGGRPVVPTLARFDLGGVAGWARPDCRP